MFRSTSTFATCSSFFSNNGSQTKNFLQLTNNCPIILFSPILDCDSNRYPFCHYYRNRKHYIHSYAAAIHALGIQQQRKESSSSTSNISGRKHNNTTSFPSQPLTIKEIRLAYFEAAKKCHPDTNSATSGVDEDRTSKHDQAELFHRITAAYEFLIQYHTKRSNSNDTNTWFADSGSYDYDDITVEEENEFRIACQMHLGLSAENVEESKQSPVFRQWLLGLTDSAYLWRTFLSQHGGLAPKLRPRLQLEMNPSYLVGPQRRRRQNR